MRRGFTLIELMIVIGITVILAGGSILYLGGFKTRQSLDLSAKSLVTFLRGAQSKSIAQEDGAQWGVRIDNTGSRASYHLFKTAGVPIDVVTLPAGVTFADPVVASFKDVIFQKSTGRPTAATNVILRLIGDASVTKTIIINTQGTISHD